MNIRINTTMTWAIRCVKIIKKKCLKRRSNNKISESGFFAIKPHENLMKPHETSTEKRNLYIRISNQPFFSLNNFNV